MLNWFKRRVVVQCKLNIRIGTTTLSAVSETASKRISASGGAINESDIAKVRSCQKSFLTDVRLALANGLTLEEIQAESDAALVGKPHGDGTRMAIEHVMRAAAKAK